jgi:hypothetical protein
MSLPDQFLTSSLPSPWRIRILMVKYPIEDVTESETPVDQLYAQVDKKNLEHVRLKLQWTSCMLKWTTRRRKMEAPLTTVRQRLKLQWTSWTLKKTQWLCAPMEELRWDLNT